MSIVWIKAINQQTIRFIKYTLWSWLFAWLDIWLLYVFTEYMHLYYIYSSLVSFAICLVLWFIYQKYYTFSSRSDRFLLEFTTFSLFQISSYVIYLVILRLWVDYLWFYYVFIAFLGKSVAFVWNFIMNHYFNFKS